MVGLSPQFRSPLCFQSCPVAICQFPAASSAIKTPKKWPASSGIDHFGGNWSWNNQNLCQRDAKCIKIALYFGSIWRCVFVQPFLFWTASIGQRLPFNIVQGSTAKFSRNITSSSARAHGHCSSQALMAAPQRAALNGRAMAHWKARRHWEPVASEVTAARRLTSSSRILEFFEVFLQLISKAQKTTFGVFLLPCFKYQTTVNIRSTSSCQTKNQTTSSQNQTTSMLAMLFLHSNKVNMVTS